MKTNSFKCWIICFTFILLASLAKAGDLKSDELNYVTTIPDSWTVTFQNSAGFSIASPDKKKTMTLLVRKADFATLDSNSIAAIEQGFLQAGSQKVSSKTFAVDGVPAYEIIVSIGKAPFATSFVNHVIIADGKLYSLQGMHMGGDVTQDSDIQGGLASFHFLQPPKPSASSRFGSLGLKLAIPVTIIAGLLFWVVRKRAA
jgi:hypothetical protein